MVLSSQFPTKINRSAQVTPQTFGKWLCPFPAAKKPRSVSFPALYFCPSSKWSNPVHTEQFPSTEELQVNGICSRNVKEVLFAVWPGCNVPTASWLEASPLKRVLIAESFDVGRWVCSHCHQKPVTNRFFKPMGNGHKFQGLLNR